MPAGQPESIQLAGAYPSQYGGITDSAALGNKTYGYEFRGPLLGCILQTNLHFRVTETLFLAWKRVLLSHSVLAVFDTFEVYESCITAWSQSYFETSQNYHKPFKYIYVSESAEGIINGIFVIFLVTGGRRIYRMKKPAPPHPLFGERGSRSVDG